MSLGRLKRHLKSWRTKQWQYTELIFFKSSNPKFVMVEANSKEEAINKAIEEDNWQKYPVDFSTFDYVATPQERKPKQVSPVWVSVKDRLPP